MNEEQDRGMIAGGEYIEQAARTRAIAHVEPAVATVSQRSAAAPVVVVNLVTFRMASTQRELGLKRLVYQCHGVLFHVRSQSPRYAVWTAGSFAKVWLSADLTISPPAST